MHNHPHGAMAQLGARLHGMQKVASSSLAGSSGRVLIMPFATTFVSGRRISVAGVISHRLRRAELLSAGVARPALFQTCSAGAADFAARQNA